MRKNKYPTPIFYIDLPQTGPWAGDYVAVMYDEFIGCGDPKKSFFRIGVYESPAGANSGIKIMINIIKNRRHVYNDVVRDPVF